MGLSFLLPRLRLFRSFSLFLPVSENYSKVAWSRSKIPDRMGRDNAAIPAAIRL